MSPYFFIFIYITFILIVYPKCICNETESLESPHEEELVSNHLETQVCDASCFKVSKSINKYKDKFEEYTKSKPFASVCFKCISCLAIAQEFNETFIKLNDDSDLNINATLKSLCSTGFKNFGLREQYSTKFVSPPLPNTEHVPSSMDGLWTTKLREMCSSFLKGYGERALYESWLADKLDFKMNEILCNNRGIFRQCKNLDYELFPIRIGCCNVKYVASLCTDCKK